MSRKTKAIITILSLLLTLVSPIIGIFGVIAMWFWTEWATWIKIIITIPFLIMLISISLATSYLFIWRPFKMAGDTMLPNFHNGEYLATKVIKTTTQLNRGDVIIFHSPSDPNKDFIKRIIGSPGEKVMIQNDNVYINGNFLDEPYLPAGTQTQAGAFLAEGVTVKLDPDQYFVLGDNRNHSSDSREWGLITRTSIISKFWFCYWNCLK